jgi:class 3 adenylate cyclase
MTSKLSATVRDDPEANSAKRVEGHVLDTFDLPEEQRHLDQLLETSPTAAASAILAGLTDPDTEQAWRRRLVLAAEVAGFTELQDQQLAPALRSFIDEFRDSNRRDDQVVVCSPSARMSA